MPVRFRSAQRTAALLVLVFVPRGESLSAYHASAVDRWLGKPGLESDTPPPVGEAILPSEVGHRLRAGRHSSERSDALKFLDFATGHLKR